MWWWVGGGWVVVGSWSKTMSKLPYQRTARVGCDSFMEAKVGLFAMEANGAVMSTVAMARDGERGWQRGEAVV